MQAVMEKEQREGFEVKDVSSENLGWDIISMDPKTKEVIRLLEVKGRTHSAPTVCITRNEIMAGLNQPEKFVLALVLVGEEGKSPQIHYIEKPFDTTGFQKNIGFTVNSVNMKIKELLQGR